jgi:hypothetical protein
MHHLKSSKRIASVVNGQTVEAWNARVTLLTARLASFTTACKWLITDVIILYEPRVSTLRHAGRAGSRQNSFP